MTIKEALVKFTCIQLDQSIFNLGLVLKLSNFTCVCPGFDDLRAIRHLYA